MGFEVSRKWNCRIAIVYWISLFMVFGPMSLLFEFNSYKGSIIFGNDPFAYFMLNGIFIATFSIGFVYMIDWIIKKRNEHKNSNGIV